MKKSRCLAVVILGVSLSAPAQNLLFNGNFESGNAGFVSGYTYQDPYYAYVLGGLDASLWSIVQSSAQAHPAWANFPDNTYGNWSGNYFIANGSPNTTTVVWQTLNPIWIAEANTAYRFETYISTLYPVSGGNGPSLTFQIGNGTNWVDLGATIAFNDGAAVGVWNLSYADGVFDTPGAYYLRLLNAQPAGYGNDFGLDDIFFGIQSAAPSFGSNPQSNPVSVTISPGPVPEPTTCFLFGVGGLLLAGARKWLFAPQGRQFSPTENKRI